MDRALTEASRARIAIVTVGRSPRTEVVRQIRAVLGDHHYEEFGALDGLSNAEIAAAAPRQGELALFTRLSDERDTIVRASFIQDRLKVLLPAIDSQNFTMIIVATTGLFQPVKSRTPLINGQKAIDAWLASLFVGDVSVGFIHPLQHQDGALSEHGQQSYGTFLRSAFATVKGGQNAKLPDAVDRVSGADIIIMHSVGYTEEMAKEVAANSGRPVISALRIIAAAASLRLSEITGQPTVSALQEVTGEGLLSRLATHGPILTARERDVMARVLEGEANKLIARSLGISHRTVEIHRAHGLAKLGSSSVAELIRRAISNS